MGTMTGTTVWCGRCQVRGRSGVLSHHLGIRFWRGELLVSSTCQGESTKETIRWCHRGGTGVGRGNGGLDRGGG